MGFSIHTDGNVASPSSAEDLLEFLAHLAQIDRDGNKRISANELVTHILAEAQNKNPDGINQLEQIRDDISAIKRFAHIDKRWREKDPAVTPQMWGKASEAQEAAQGRLGELLGYEPQFIANVLRENESNLAALKSQQEGEATAAKEAADEAAADNAERAQTRREIEAALPPNMRHLVKGITDIAPSQSEIPAASFGAAQEEILKIRQQLAAYKPENVEMPNLGALDRALSGLTPQSPKDTGKTVP